MLSSFAPCVVMSVYYQSPHVLAEWLLPTTSPLLRTLTGHTTCVGAQNIPAGQPKCTSSSDLNVDNYQFFRGAHHKPITYMWVLNVPCAICLAFDHFTYDWATFLLPSLSLQPSLDFFPEQVA